MHITSLVPREVMEFYYDIVPTPTGKQCNQVCC
jgi:NADH:ubiquinone oxidoreductase subunit E